MSRYIDLEELERRIKENVLISGGGNTPYEVDLLEWCRDECIRQGYAMPTADVEEVRHGEWEKMRVGNIVSHIRCSNCGEYEGLRTQHINFCPNCGAKMDGERRDQNEG